jgi:hypothetical protein
MATITTAVATTTTTTTFSSFSTIYILNGPFWLVKYNVFADMN